MIDSRLPRQPLRPMRLLAQAAALSGLLAIWSEPVLAQARSTPTERATERAATRAADRAASRPGDFIVAVVNQELVTAVEVEMRMRRAQEEATRSGQRLVPDAQLRPQIIDELIEERVILTFSRDNGGKVDDVELDRAVQTVAAQNQMKVDQLRERLKADGIDYGRFRANLSDQLLVERTREREVYPRIRITDSEIDQVIEQQRSAARADAVLNLAQVLIKVPEGASDAEVADRRVLAEAALAKVKRGEPFERVAAEMSDDASTKAKGGELGPRPTSRWPDLFVNAVKALKDGDVVATPVRSGAGFHVLKLLSSGEGANAGLQVTQTRARHILLRPSPQLKAEQAQARLAEYRRQIEAGQATFEDIARRFSEDGSGPQGGDLGWSGPGQLVPEFEEAMNRLPLNGLSAPVASRFGVHLIQVLERRQVAIDPKQLREQARNSLREQKFEGAYADWVKDLRGRAYIEMREPPL